MAAPTLVQSKWGTTPVTLDATPTAGNLLVVIVYSRNADPPPTNPTGFTQIATADNDVFGSFNKRQIGVSIKTSDGADGSITFTGGEHALFMEWTGSYQSVVVSQSDIAATTNIECGGAIAPTAGTDVVLLGGAVIGNGDSGSPSVSPLDGATEVLDTMPGGFSPLQWAAYRSITGAGGSYTVSGTCTDSLAYGGITLVIQGSSAAPEPGYWFDWAGDGFDTGAGAAASSDPRLARGLPQAGSIGTANGGDNVTSFVMSSTWHRGGSYDHVGASGPGGFTILLDNSTGRFDPDNSASDLFGFVRPGVPVWAGAIAATGAVGTANGTGTVAGFLAGYVREFVPTVDASGRRVCEVIGEDAFGRYGRSVVAIAPSLGRSHAAFRGLILDGVGEAAARRALDSETGVLPFSAVESENGLDVLEELNKATATRHFIRPADNKEDWYDYVSVNKLHKLQAAADQSLDGDDISAVSGWRVTEANVIETQRATVVPITTSSNNNEVWRFADTPFTMSAIRPRRIIANFDDYVFDASVDVNFVSGSGTAGITNYGKSAQVTIWADGVSATIGSVVILGRQIVRGDSITVVAGDETPGALSGQTISSDYIGQTGAAQGLVDFTVWKFGQPLKRPSVTVDGKNAASLATIFGRDLFDVMTLSVDRLSITTARRVEIVGLRGSHQPARSGLGHWSVTYELQETPNQQAVDWFDVDTDSVNGPTVIAPF